MRFRYWALVALLMLILVAVVAVSNGDSSRDDVRVHYGWVDSSTPRVIEFGNHSPRVETKCDGFGHRLYTVAPGRGNRRNLIVIPDRSCQGPGTSFDDILRSHEQPPAQMPSINPADYLQVVISP